MRMRLVLLSALSFGCALSAWAQADSRDAFPSYEWAEGAPTVKVSKRLLKELAIPSVDLPKPETQDFTITPLFIDIFRLTKNEVERVSKAIAEAQHEYRSAELRNLTHEENGVVAPEFLRIGARDQVFHFQLKPFPEEAEAVHRKLESAVREALGPQRAEYFLENGGVLKGHMPLFPDDPRMFWNSRGGVTCTFVLPAKHPGRVDRHYWTRGGGGGLTFGPTLDRYAPEPLKTALVEWRKVETPIVAPAEAKREAVPQAVAGEWNDASEHVEISKEALRSIKLGALNREEKLAPEICALLGLGDNEQAAALKLFAEHKAKFEIVKRAHFGRVEPGKPLFVIKAFPEQSAQLKAEWARELGKLLGATRGELLDAAFRRTYQRKAGSPAERMKAIREDVEERRLGMGIGRGQNWLHRGEHEVRMTFEPNIDAKGRRTYRYEYAVQAEGGQRASGTALAIPPAWDHLFTPDVIPAPAGL